MNETIFHAIQEKTFLDYIKMNYFLTDIVDI